MTQTARPEGSGELGWYMTGQASWFISLGMQFVLFPHLVANVLQQPAFLVGVAQMCLQIPNLLFMLVGGLAAERSDCRSILVRVHLLAAVPALGLGYAVLQGLLSYEILIVYALAMGTLGAFAVPARDSSLSRMAGADVQRAVTIAMGVQLTGQLFGMLSVQLIPILPATLGLTEADSVSFFLHVQAAVMLLGGMAVYQLKPMPSLHKGTAPRLDDILDGLRTVRRSPSIFPVVVLITSIGLFYVGSFMVLMPLMVRDIYGGGVSELSAANLCFWGGTILATITLLRIGHVEARGKVLVFSVGTGAVILLLFSFPMPFWMLCFLIFLWGIGAGTTMTITRTIVQGDAPPTHRARVLSIYQLGMMGGGPIGSFGMGGLIGIFGLTGSVILPALAMGSIISWLCLRTQLWRLHAPRLLPESEADPQEPRP
ncbi:MFS transporter [Tepidicaulis sp. LMO-SS28]|uniref:MFS transporter n=1 Tax=Tepidicaulis sp. LMO-SS28 TaxID=3447455 RepID=UPI003EE2F371